MIVRISKSDARVASLMSVIAANWRKECASCCAYVPLEDDDLLLVDVHLR